MGGPIGKLSDLRLRSAKPQERVQKLSDGRGLQFWITPTGGKYWRLDYRFQGRKRLLTIGGYPDVSAATAREIAARAREMLAKGVDPQDAKKQAKAASQEEVENTFGNFAKRLIEKKRKENKASITLSKMEWIL